MTTTRRLLGPLLGVVVMLSMMYVAMSSLLDYRPRLDEPLRAASWAIGGVAIGGLVAVVPSRASRMATGLILLTLSLVGALVEIPALSALAGDHGIWVASAVMLTLGVAPAGNHSRSTDGPLPRHPD